MKILQLVDYLYLYKPISLKYTSYFMLFVIMCYGDNIKVWKLGYNVLNLDVVQEHLVYL